MGTLNVQIILIRSMTAQDTTRRLRPQTISQDISSFHDV